MHYQGQTNKVRWKYTLVPEEDFKEDNTTILDTDLS